ncbi:hypothetical protein RRG08_020343 [Elysia crispata]|uniref:Uncharacterized protein n=1 Tax=Elysia crispata TaxID=231223 RepID=A0AAE1AE17_9GAST|nr:hypothetical protein RRG08_020343 [Elysia crispata]
MGVKCNEQALDSVFTQISMALPYPVRRFPALSVLQKVKDQVNLVVVLTTFNRNGLDRLWFAATGAVEFFGDTLDYLMEWHVSREN